MVAKRQKLLLIFSFIKNDFSRNSIKMLLSYEDLDGTLKKVSRECFSLSFSVARASRHSRNCSLSLSVLFLSVVETFLGSLFHFFNKFYSQFI